MRFVTEHLSETGGRPTNQDACGSRALASGLCCWALADGLGGHSGGEVAARTAVDAVLAAFEQTPEASASALRRYVDAAHAGVRALQRQEARLASMRTTLVVLLSDADAAAWAHVGDSRLYHLRAGRIIYQTEDHSVPQAMVAAGDLRPEDVRFHEDRNRLLRSLGQTDEPRPDVLPQPRTLTPGDAFLLCTDGFWEYVRETEMEVDFAKADDPGRWLALMRERLRGRAEAGHDNYSAVAVFVDA